MPKSTNQPRNARLVSKPKRPLKRTRKNPEPEAQAPAVQDDPVLEQESLRLADAGDVANPENTFGKLDGRRILYYPGAGKDFTPLFRLTHLYDTFIYADYGSEENEFRNLSSWIHDALPGHVGLKVMECQPIAAELLDRLRDDPSPPNNRGQHQGYEKSPWGVHVRLTRTVGRIERPLDLFYLCLDGVAVYRNLFLKSCTSPRGICFIATDGFALNYTQFGKWSERLAEAVRENPRKPEFVIDANGVYDWPWNKVWQLHPNWAGMHGGTVTCYTLPTASTSETEAPVISRVLQNHLSRASGLEVVVRRGFQPPAGIKVICRTMPSHR